MMTDPRIAALAAALNDGPYPWGELQEWAHERYREQAAAILAALDGWTLVPTDSDSTIEHIEWQRAEIARLGADNEFAVLQLLNAEAEITRLRKIEEAARKAVLAARKMTPEIAVLNAALARGSE